MNLCIDANLLLYFFLPASDQNVSAKNFFSECYTKSIGLYAPSLIYYEVLSNIYKEIVLKRISKAHGSKIVGLLEGMNIKYISHDVLIDEIWNVANDKRYVQNKAYDAVYIASANYLKVNLWTYDRKYHAYGFKNIKSVIKDIL